MRFAKACIALKATERSTVCIMGFNSPEWVFSFVGSILSNLVVSGIYTTNAAEACCYQAEHSETEIIVCESYAQASLFDLTRLSKVRAVVIWGEKAL